MKFVEVLVICVLLVHWHVDSYKFEYRRISRSSSHLNQYQYLKSVHKSTTRLESQALPLDSQSSETRSFNLFDASQSAARKVLSKFSFRGLLRNLSSAIRKTKKHVMRSLMTLSMIFLLITGTTEMSHASRISSSREPIAVVASAHPERSSSAAVETKSPKEMKEALKTRVKKSTASIKKFLNIGEADDNPAVEALESITSGIVEAETEAVGEFEKSWRSLAESLSGVKHDGLFILVVTSIIVPLFRHLKVSPIIGFLLTGTIVGPTGLNWVNDVHMIDVLGELGIVFFLFEMGLELSMERLQKMKRDVFGLGTSQFLMTAAAIGGMSALCGLSPAASVTIGGSLALSSSAFVLQLLKDKNAMGTRHGKASFGILLLQDLAVVPLIVIVELLSQGGSGLGKALTIAGIKALLALQMMSYFGRKLLNPIFYAVAKSSSQEAFLSIILSTVLMMSFFTKGIGLSDTLGAFLAGLLLAETKYGHQIEADIAPFRGLLLGVFFITVGFSIDLNILLSEFPVIVGLLVSLLASKTAIVTGLCSLFGIPLSSAAQCGLLTSQGGEFAFVSLGIAQRAGLIPAKLSKMLLTTVALSMAATPALAELAVVVANRLERSKGYSEIRQNSLAEAVKAEMKSENFVVVCGYGRIGKMVCDMLDRKFVRYIAIDNSPQRTSEAKNKGLPVFYGDVTRPEVLKGFDIGDAEACVIAIDDISITNRVVMGIRKYYPELPIIVRAKNSQHQRYLDSNFANIYAMSPVLPDDSVLLTLPFGGAVLQKVGVSKPEIDAILEDFRKMYIDDKELDEGSFDFLTSFRRRLPPTIEVPPPQSIEASADIILANEISNAASAALIPHAEVGYLSPETLLNELSSNTETPESPDFFIAAAEAEIPAETHATIDALNRDLSQDTEILSDQKQLIITVSDNDSEDRATDWKNDIDDTSTA